MNIGRATHAVSSKKLFHTRVTIQTCVTSFKPVSPFMPVLLP
jgi:hypothetical protein